MSSVENAEPASPRRTALLATALLSWLGFVLLAAGLLLVLSP
jgi:hypothetical protein